MPKLYEKCSKCGNNWMGCMCENYHPPITVTEVLEGEVVLTRDEVKMLRHLLNYTNVKSLPQELREKIWGFN